MFGCDNRVEWTYRLILMRPRWCCYVRQVRLRHLYALPVRHLWGVEERDSTVSGLRAVIWFNVPALSLMTGKDTYSYSERHVQWRTRTRTVKDTYSEGHVLVLWRHVLAQYTTMAMIMAIIMAMTAQLGVPCMLLSNCAYLFWELHEDVQPSCFGSLRFVLHSWRKWGARLHGLWCEIQSWSYESTISVHIVSSTQQDVEYISAADK